MEYFYVVNTNIWPEIADRDKSNIIFMQSFRRVIYPEESLIKESIW
ncbi:hypothetical protein THER_0636 [Thermodesulfovibrio sp. N1]|nr:hypothetical protein THER_0636 [Thermodesulfovibrio sp. N1]